MRVISGIYGRRRWDVPHGFKARPTTDFAKEGLFDVLAGRIDFGEGLHALDLFAGTGSISVELLSRGCARVVSVEKEGAHHAFICKVMRELGAEDRWLPVRGDVFKFVGSTAEQFHFVFADPPYKLAELESLPDLVLGGRLLAEGGLFVLEHGRRNDFGQHPRFVEHRAYGSVNFSFFR